ncbi:MAG: DEAD/DEAH box helicase [Acidobacteria bacterium]|nr:MAG: DEAD/DEAH box helicase [Acidobacteriota bacterium]
MTKSGLGRKKLKQFSDYSLNETIQKNIADMGFEAPTDVQAASLEPILDKKDVVINSHTGSGKTAAFMLPFIQNTRLDIPAVQYIVLVPTRELAAQVHREGEKFAKDTGVKLACIYGGLSYKKQIQDLKNGAQIVVGTPGRILDHLKRRTLTLSVTRGMALDEGDKMLSMGFLPEVRLILDYLPKRHQTILSSATFPPAIESIIEQYMMDPVRVSMMTQSQTAKEISHFFTMIGQSDKEKVLLSFLEQEEPDCSLIFCNTRSEVTSVYQFLKHAGQNVEALSSDFNQKKREKILHDLRIGAVTHLVCTDLAARGIDIPHLSHVFIFSSGEDLEAYVHRTGRTGRAGRAGKAISLVSGQDIANFNMALKVHEISAIEIQPPTDEEITASRSRYYTEQLHNISFAKDADVNDEFSIIAEQLDEEQVQSLLPFLLERYFKSPKIWDWSRIQTQAQDSIPEQTQEPSREPRRPKRTSPIDQPVTICVALGQKDGLDDYTLRGLFKKLARMRLNQIGRTVIYDYESFVEISRRTIRSAMRLNGKRFRHHEIRIAKSPVPIHKADTYELTVVAEDA